MNTLQDMPNISKMIEKDLVKAGISTPQELCRLGSKEAFLRIRLHANPDACVNKLYALEGAVRNVRWHHLPQEEKKDKLKTFFHAL